VPVDLSVPTGLALSQALAAAAEALSREVPDLKSVESLGITYQQRGAETPLGAYIGREIAARLPEKIRAQAATPAALLRPDMDRADRTLPSGDVMVRGRPGAYLLSGTLWDLGQDLEVRLSLQGPGERAASYGMRIRRDTIPTAMLAGAPTQPAARRDSGAVATLRLSSDRGQRPVYAVGDSARLVVQAARDGYLYCFHQASPAAGGGITKIFPNPYHPAAQVQGGLDVHIPEPGMGFALRVFGPSGVEQVRCFASDRDLATGLAPGILGRDLEPLGVHSLDDLGRLFRTVPAANVADATLVMTIAPRDEARAQGARTPAKNAP
jgi:hypothetical protein